MSRQRSFRGALRRAYEAAVEAAKRQIAGLGYVGAGLELHSFGLDGRKLKISLRQRDDPGEWGAEPEPGCMTVARAKELLGLRGND